MTLLPRVLLLAAVPFVLATSVLAQQESPGQGQRAEHRYQIVQLQHISAPRVAHMLDQLGAEVASGAASDQRLVLRGREDNVARALDLIHQLDQPMEADERVEFIPLGMRSTTQLGPMLNIAAGDTDTRMAIDERNNLLVVSGPPAAVEQIRQLVHRLPEARGPISLEFYFLRGTIGAGGDSAKGTLPKDLLPVAEALRAKGFGWSELLAPVVVNVREDGKFSSESTRQLRPEGNEEELAFEVRGAAHPQPQADRIRIDVSAAVTGTYTRYDRNAGGEVAGSSESPILYEVSTEVIAPAGEFVVLAAAPSSTASGDAIAVAMRMMPTAN